jgi:hypothetical protein
MVAIGRNKAMAIISIVRIAICVVLNWLFIGYWQQRFGNGAIALVIIAGLAEIPATIACWVLLPKGAVGSAVTLNVVRACVASLCTGVPLSMLQPLGLLYLIPLFALLFAVTAMVTRLVSPSDLRLAVEIARSRLLASQATKSIDLDGMRRQAYRHEAFWDHVTGRGLQLSIDTLTRRPGVGEHCR